LDISRPAVTHEATLWNGPSGQAWVDTKRFLDPMFQPLEDLLLEKATMESASRVLDVGCGAGSTTLAFARRLNPSACTGIDISEPLIHAARACAVRDGALVNFICADAQTYAFEPSHFDLIVSRFGIMFFSDLSYAFTNLRRAATHGGQLRLIVWRAPEENPFMTTAERAAAPLLPKLTLPVAGARGQFALADPDRIYRVLDQSGWTDIDVRPADVACTLPENELVTFFTLLGPLGRIFPGMDEETRATVIATVRAAFDPYVYGADVRYDAACWIVSARACSPILMRCCS